MEQVHHFPLHPFGIKRVTRAVIMAQQVELATPISHIIVPFGVSLTPFLIQIPANGPGKVEDQVLSLLPLTGEARIEFLALGFDLAQV